MPSDPFTRLETEDCIKTRRPRLLDIDPSARKARAGDTYLWGIGGRIREANEKTNWPDRDSGHFKKQKFGSVRGNLGLNPKPPEIRSFPGDRGLQTSVQSPSGSRSGSEDPGHPTKKIGKISPHRATKSGRPTCLLGRGHGAHHRPDHCQIRSTRLGSEPALRRGIASQPIPFWRMSSEPDLCARSDRDRLSSTARVLRCRVGTG